MSDDNGNGRRVPWSSSRLGPPLARLVGRRPTKGAAPAAKQVAEDVSALLRAEINLAKAELASAAKDKALGAALFIVAAIIGWLAVQAVLITLGFVIAIWLPGWAAAMIVTALLLAGAGLAVWLGVKRMRAEMSLATTKRSVSETQEVAKAAVERSQASAREGVAEAQRTLKETAQDVRERLQLRFGGNGRVNGNGNGQHPSVAPSALTGVAAPQPGPGATTSAAAATSAPPTTTAAPEPAAPPSTLDAPVDPLPSPPVAGDGATTQDRTDPDGQETDDR